MSCSTSYRELACRDDRRRHEVRRQEWNGLDYLEVSDDQLELSLFFLGRAPDDLTPENFQIRGGRRIRGIEVLEVELVRREDPELDDRVVVTVDRPGDFSTYEIGLVNLPEDSHFDPRYRSIPFSFKVGCPSDQDCAVDPVCREDPASEPDITYLAKDYASFRRLILDRLSLLLPEWRDRQVPDLGITLVELLAYVGDHLSYEQDAVATEAYLHTARRRISLRRHARLVDYLVHEGNNARVWIHVATTSDVTLGAADLSLVTGIRNVPSVEGRVLRWEELRQVPASAYEVFEPLVDDPEAELTFRSAHNEIRLHTWGDAECRLQEGATSATLIDGPGPRMEEASNGAQVEPVRILDLNPGDVLILEEVIGPETGDPADADPTRRHPVRLVQVEPGIDELLGQPVLEVEWDPADALPFGLCISTIGPAPECRLLRDVSVARGNVVLADHGRTLDPPEELGEVPLAEWQAECAGEGVSSEPLALPGRFRPALSRGPLTFAEAPPGTRAATLAVRQDPRRALPWIRLDGPELWSPRRDLLASGAENRHYVVEMDDRRRAHLRFGDGELGRPPAAGSAFRARYRVGNGPVGNVGADSIRLAVTRDLVSGTTLEPRNPLPATGGTAPESPEEIRRAAPEAFRHRRERAVTEDDYAELAGRHPAVQRAAAELRWNGSWIEARVAVDPFGSAEAPPELLSEIEEDLYRFRRLGHDLAVLPARTVPIDLVIEICVRRGFARSHVLTALRARFGTGRLPDGSPAFFHPDALTFGQGIAVSRLVAHAMAVNGVESAAAHRLQRLFEEPNGELRAGILEIGPLEIARLDDDPSFPEHGRLRINLRGGR